MWGKYKLRKKKREKRLKKKQEYKIKIKIKKQIYIYTHVGCAPQCAQPMFIRGEKVAFCNSFSPKKKKRR